MISFTTVDWTELSLQVIITFTHFFWIACVVAVLLELIQQGFLRRQDSSVSNANSRYMIANLAFFSLPICLLATFIWVHHWRGPFTVADNQPSTSATTGGAIDSATTPTSGIAEKLGLPSALSPVAAGLPAPATIAPQHAALFDRTWPDRARAFAPGVMIAYVIGVAFMLLRLGSSLASSSRLCRSAQPITDADWLAIVVEQASRLGLRRLPVVALCPRVTVPMVVGIIKPMVLVPPALMCSMDPNQLAAILSHELAHLRRYDLLLNLLQRIVEALLFFHPVTWWISRRIRIERENCCDDMAAAGCGRLEYASALLRMAEQCAALRRTKLVPQFESLAADGGNASQLGYRIGRLLDRDDAPRVALTRSTVSVFAFVTALAVAMTALAQTASDDRANQRRAENAATPRPEAPGTTPERPSKNLAQPPAKFVEPEVEASVEPSGETQAQVIVRPDYAVALDRISIDSRICELPRALFDQIQPLLGTSVAVDSATTGIARRQPPSRRIGTVITLRSSNDRDSVIDLIQQDPKANVKTLPTLRTFNGRTVEWDNLVERPVVPEHEDNGGNNDGRQSREPTNHTLREGLQLSIRPVNQSDSIELNLELTLSKIDTARASLFSNATDDALVRLPSSRQAIVNTSLSLSKGQTLAVAIPSLDNPEHVVLCLFTPQVDDGDSAQQRQKR